MNRNDLQLIFVLILIVSAIAIMINSHKKKRRHKKEVKNLSAIIHQYPLIPEESKLAVFDNDVFYDRYYSAIDPTIKIADDVFFSHPDLGPEVEKRQLIGNLVESIRIKKQAEVIGVREQLKEGEYKHTYDILKALPPKKVDEVVTKVFSERIPVEPRHLEDFRDPETLDNTVEESANIKDYKIPSDAQVNTLLGVVLPETKEEEPEEPEDYLRQFIFKDGKWIKNPSK